MLAQTIVFWRSPITLSEGKALSQMHFGNQRNSLEKLDESLDFSWQVHELGVVLLRAAFVAGAALCGP